MRTRLLDTTVLAALLNEHLFGRPVAIVLLPPSVAQHELATSMLVYASPWRGDGSTGRAMRYPNSPGAMGERETLRSAM